MRRLLLPAVLLALLAGCAATSRIDGTAELQPRTETPQPRRTLAVKRSTQAVVRVTVVNGDTHRRVSGARVVIGKRAGYTDAKGVAKVRLRARTALEVRASAPGYGTRTVRMPFKTRRLVTIKLYRPELQWTMYGASPSRTQAQREIAIRPPFKVVWSRGVGSLIEFPAVVADGVAYIGNYSGTIYALSMADGKRVWRYDPPGGKMASSPAVVGRNVVVHGMDGIVRVIDRANGRLRWQLDIGSPIESSPVVRDGLDYFGAWNGRVYALDLAKRRLRWTHASGAKVTSSAALAGKTLYIGNYAGRLLALSSRTGKLRFSAGVNGRIYGTPAIAGGRVFVPSSTGGSLTAFSTSGSRLWRVNTGSYVYSSPAVWAGRVFFGSYNGYLYSVAASSGRILWTRHAGGPVSGAAVVVGGVAYAGSTHNRITGVDARSGRVVLSFPHGEYVPVSGNGNRLLLHGYSRLYAVEAL